MNKIGFIGGGAMATALIAGIINGNVARPEEVYVSDISSARLEELKNKYGINIISDNKHIVEQCQVIILAVKPYLVSDILKEISTYISEKHLVLSIAAGIPINFYEELLPKEAKFIRVMPNTPSLVGMGATAIALGTNSGKLEENIALEIFSAVGKAVTLKEDLMDSVTGLSGSGPAYMYLVIEALADGGVLMGLPRDTSIMLAAQTMLGTAQMVLATGEHPAKLKDMVTTPGGTTIAGLYELEKGGTRINLIKAVKKATERSKELSNK